MDIINHIKIKSGPVELDGVTYNTDDILQLFENHNGPSRMLCNDIISNRNDVFLYIRGIDNFTETTEVDPAVAPELSYVQYVQDTYNNKELVSRSIMQYEIENIEGSMSLDRIWFGG